VQNSKDLKNKDITHCGMRPPTPKAAARQARLDEPPARQGFWIAELKTFKYFKYKDTSYGECGLRN
jgi:hypothetical protein